MDIEEIKKVFFDVLREAGLVKEDKAEAAEDEIKDAVKEEMKEEVKEEVKDKLDDLAEKKADEVIEEAKTDKTEEVKEEVKNEACDEVKKEEVIKAEVLNQKPTLGLAARGDADKWRSMNHTEFMKYIESGAYKQDL